MGSLFLSLQSAVRRIGVLAIASTLAMIAAPAQAQTLPTGFQQYHVLGHEQQMWDIYNRIVATDPVGGFALQNAMTSVVSITVSTDNQLVIYDHWEDGFEADIFFPGQASTLVFGNGVDGDGRACDYIGTRACVGDPAIDDQISRGENLTFSSSAGANLVPPNCGGAGNLAGCVPVNVPGFGTGGPGGTGGRDPSFVRFDGGDLIQTNGGPVAAVHLQEPSAVFGGVPINNVLGGAVEMVSLQTVSGATSYSIPVGEDTFTKFGGAQTSGEPFQTVALEIVAFEDGTNVQIVSPGAGTVTFTLDEGEHYSTLGMIDGRGTAPPGIAAPAITINEGTKISTSAPISAMMVAGGDGAYASRTFPIIPDLLHGNDYVISAPGDNTSGAPGDNVNSDPLNLYIFNPDPLSDLDVTITDSRETRTITVPAGQSVSYGEKQVRDEFETASYSNQDGIDSWSTDWIESDAGGAGPGAGNVLITGGELSLDDNPDVAGQISAEREVDLSDFDRVILTFDFRTVGTLEGGDSVTVEVSSNGGTSYSPLTTYSNDQADSTATFDISASASANTRIRFRVSSGYNGGGEQFRVDNVQIAGSKFVPPDSTVRLTSDRDFWGFSAYDHLGTGFDWGSSWLATSLLSDSYTAPRAPTPGDTSAVFVAPTEDNTCVRIDFDNDGTFDQSSDGFGVLLPFAGTTTCSDGYLVDTLGSLSIIDPDGDTTGARLATDKPVSVTYGLETDTTAGGVSNLDLGYAAYPANELFLDSVLTIEKSADRTAVPAAGSVVTYTLTVDSYGFGPLANLAVSDLLPTGVPASSYVAGSTVITLPDLSTVSGSAADPTGGPDPDGSGRDLLDWGGVLSTAGADTLLAEQTLTVIYQVAIPGGLSGAITNEGRADATLGATTFSPTDTADVVVTDLAISKSVSDDGTPEAGDVLTYSVSVSNTGAADEPNVVVTDPVPAGTTFCDDTIDPVDCDPIVNAGPFTGVYVPSANAVVWTAPLLPLGSGPFVLSFDVKVNPTAPAGADVSNTANIESDNVPSFDSNTTVTTLVGPALVIDKVALGSPTPVHPGEIVTFDITVDNVGAGTADNLLILDPIQVNGTYVPDSLEWRLNAGAFQPLTDANDGLEASGADGRANAGVQVELRVPALGPGEDITFRFQVTVTGPDGGNLTNQASVSSDEIAPADTPLVQIPIDGNATITGHLFVDSNGDGVQQAGEPNLANVDVVVTDEDGNTQRVTTDANGDYSVVVPADGADDPLRVLGQTTLDVDESDPDVPAGATLTTGNDPQDVIAVASGTVASGAVGYQPQLLTVSKTSDAAGGVVAPGDTLTYTITVDNSSGVNQSNVTLTDTLPAGVTYVPGSTVVIAPALRVTEYFIGSGFSGNSFDLTLNQDLASDYFVVVQGSDGDTSGGGDRGPDENYVRLVSDPSGTGELAVSSASNVIGLSRQNAVNDWVGVVTVVESLPNAGADGFVLRDVREVTHSGASTSGFEDITGSFAIGQTLLMGGFNGAGCETAAITTADTKVCHVRFFPSGSNRINWTRDAGGGVTLSTATSTVMAIEWGANWTVQRTRVQGTNGGNGANATSEYDTAAIAAVARDNTWVWGTGHTTDNGIGDAAEGVLITLGDGVSQSATESTVAVGAEFTDGKDFEVWAMTHPGLTVDYRFVVDVTEGAAGDLIEDVTVDAEPGNRMAIAYNGMDGTGNAYPRPMFSARYVDDTTVRLERRRSGQEFPAWVQGIGFANVLATASGGAPPALASGYELPAGARLTVTFQVQVDDPLAAGITSLTNTVDVTSTQVPGGVSDDHTDTVIRPAVDVSPDASATVPFDAGGARVASFTHTVTNTGDTADSYSLAGFSASGFEVRLVDPITGTVIVTDSDGDGVWDGGASPNTGTLAAGETVNYRFDVVVPAGTAIGTTDSARLQATSDTRATVSDLATDTIAVIDDSIPGSGDVVVSPDNATTTDASSSVVYTHSVTNNTGAPRAFELQANSSQGWTATIYADSNGDGVYTAGVDTAISNTAALADGASQTIFVVVDVPAGTEGDVDLTTVAASFFDDGGTPGDTSDDISFGGTATDTTTVRPASSSSGVDLTGGGTRVVNAGDVPVYPGTLTNTGDAADSFELTISASVYADGLSGPGEQPDDGLPHTSELVIDTTGDGAPDTVIARDNDGDGVWDEMDVDGSGDIDTAPDLPAGGVFPAGTYNADGDATPDVSLAAGSTVAYSVRRPVDTSQGPMNDIVTLTATSSNDPTQLDSVAITTSVLAPTLAQIGEMVAYDSGRGVIVEWTTDSEHGTVGFTLYRENPRNGRWSRINRKLVPALLHSRNGGVYRLRDRRVRVGQVHRYKLVELEATGAKIEHGPYQVTIMAAKPSLDVPEPVERPLPGFERVRRSLSAVTEQRIEDKLTARRAAFNRRLARRAPVVKISVRERGLYRLEASALATVMGIDESSVRELIQKGRLRVTNAGQRVATLREGNAAVLFYGEPIVSQYTDENVYRVHAGRGLGMGGINTASRIEGTAETFPYVAHAEGNRYPITHLFDDPDDDYWMWDFRFEDMMFPNNDPHFAVATPNVAAGGAATITVRLHGALEAVHRARLVLEGSVERELGVIEWSGLAPLTETFEVDALDLGNGETRIRVEGLGSGDPDNPSTFYINDIDIQYPRAFEAVDGLLAAPTEAYRTITAHGFESSDLLVLDVTDPKRPRRVHRARISNVQGAVSVELTPQRSVRSVFIAERERVLAPLAMVADTPSDLRYRGHRVDWLMITSHDMIEQAERLAAYRRDQGLRTLVIDIEDVYDEFAHGVRDADAIWSMLRFAYDRWTRAPRYVVLGGEGSFDYKNHLGFGDSIIPTLLAPTVDGLFPSDNLYGDVRGNDYLLEMAIGRLPAIDAAEMAQVVDKIIRYEASTGEWSKRVTFGADAPDAGGDFPASSDAVLTAVPHAEVDVETVHLDSISTAAARALVIDGLNEGRGFVNFFGHAATGSIGNAAPALIGLADLTAGDSPLSNGDRLPVLTAFTCLVGQFGRPGGDALGELLVLTPDKGAAAVFSPSGLSRNQLAERLGLGFYRATYGDGELVIGEVILKAQAHYARGGLDKYLLDIYNLLGDPATIMK